MKEVKCKRDGLETLYYTAEQIKVKKHVKRNGEEKAECIKQRDRKRASWINKWTNGDQE